MCENNENPVEKRIAIKAECTFISPALIGSGLSENTDSDVLRDKNGNAFLPGSAVAGVLREAVPEALVLFGEGRLSPLWTFDAELSDSENHPAKVIELDGVEIGKENKVAIDSKKYDFEAVETGSKFTLRLLLTIREKDKASDYENLLIRIVSALESGNIAFGAKTRRGFGAVKCESVVKREFDFSKDKHLDKWLDFEWDSGDWEKEKEKDSGTFSAKTEAIVATLSLTGSIMIRDTRNIYVDPNKEKAKEKTPEKAPDYKHISSNGDPVIFGTSWAGAFRSGLYRLLNSIYPDKAEKYLDNVFGYVYEKDKDGIEPSKSSEIIFNSSFLKMYCFL